MFHLTFTFLGESKGSNGIYEIKMTFRHRFELYETGPNEGEEPDADFIQQSVTESTSINSSNYARASIIYTKKVKLIFEEQ